MDKQKALDAALGQIERSFGKGSIMRLGQQEQAVDIETVSTGSLGLDIALGIGGLPRGRVVEIYGPESSGKTTLALHVVAEAQKLGGTCAFVDAEHALDPAYAKKLGVELDDLLISQRWCAPAPSTCWSSTRWPPWCRGPSSKARWATAMSACMRG
jgi:recombination protein RecA